MPPTVPTLPTLSSQPTEEASPNSTPVPGGGEGLLPGTLFHGLRIHSKLGDGGMGVTYLASHPILQMPLVIKTFKTLAPDASQIFREAHFAARVTSKNVVSPVDAGFESGIPFVVQRYVDGIDADELLGRFRAMGRRLPLDLVLRIVTDVARGLHDIHQAGVVHRDVKPANLFLSGAGHASVGDFGIALETLARGVSDLAGTPAFIAPEVWSADRPIDRRADVYALGATAHLLATGEVPFPGRSLSELRLAHCNTIYQAPRTREPREAYLYAVIERALSKSPEDRYPNALALALALEPLIERPLAVTCVGPFAARLGDVELEMIVGDLAAHAPTDVVVCSANTSLRMREGVADALRRAAGDVVETEAMAQAPAAMGDVPWTSAGVLPALYMAHAVSAMDGGICLQRCMLRLLLEAEVRGLETITMPVIGTGIGRVPVDLGAKLIIEAIRTFASLAPLRVRHVRIHLLDAALRQRAWAILDSM